jgi:hypothetical protein
VTDNTRAPAPARTRPTARTTATGYTAAALAAAWIGGGFTALSAPAEFTVLLITIPVAARVLRPRSRGHPRAPDDPGHPARPDGVDARGALPWLAVLLAFGAWEFYALARGGSAHPTVSALAAPILSGHLERSAGYLLWMAAGAWIGRR